MDNNTFLTNFTLEGKTLTFMHCEQYNISNSDQILDACSQKLKENPEVTSLVFDFTDTTYVSSAGFRIFSALLQECCNRSVDLMIINVNDDLKTLFDMSGYSQALNIK